MLPLLPIVLGAALTEHRYGPVALAAGVALAYVAVGLFVATIGFAIGFDQDVFRYVAAVLLIVIGACCCCRSCKPGWRPPLDRSAIGRMRRAAACRRAGSRGQFGVGLLLGAVWSPCVGPTLGAASVLAGAGQGPRPRVAATMLAFGIGAAAPLVALGGLSRQALLRWRDRLLKAGKSGKYLLGGLLLFVGVLIVSGLDTQAGSRAGRMRRRPGSPN